MSAIAAAVRGEERAARGRQRGLEKAQRAARRLRERSHRDAVATAIRAALSGSGGRSCRCGLHPHMTVAELRALGAGCTGPRYVCPVLDAVRRRVAR